MAAVPRRGEWSTEIPGWSPPRVSGRGGREISLDLISQAPGCIAVRPVQGVWGHFRKHTIILYSHLMKICVECFDPGHLGHVCENDPGHPGQLNLLAQRMKSHLRKPMVLTDLTTPRNVSEYGPQPLRDP